MQEIIKAFTEIQSDLPWRNLFIGFSFLIVAQVVLRIIDFVFGLLISNKKDKVDVLAARKFFVYTFNLCCFLFFLKVTQVQLKVILGATGLMTLAIGFAARTPISNLISGIFLVFERPFVIGNIIEINSVKGEVVSRNLLSLTIRTLDNVMLRIPNEEVISSLVSNNSYFPIRRFDLKYLLSNLESLTRLEQIFQSVASRNVMALDEPLPYFYVREFKENHSEVIFRVWCSSDDFLTFQSEFPKEIHRAVKAAGIEPIRQPVEIVNSQMFSPQEQKSQ